MLIALLFKLGIEQRAGELGTLAAVGLDRRQHRAAAQRARDWSSRRSGRRSASSAGVVYAWLMITGLRTWWVAAVSTPFLTLHVTPRSLLIGWLVGVVVSWLTIRWSIRRLARLPAGRLLAGATETAATRRRRRSAHRRSWPRMREALVALAVALGVVGFLLHGEAQAGVFFGSGAAVLALLLGRSPLPTSRGRPEQAVASNAFTLAALSALNTARNPGRSTLTIGLVATATFLIAAISAFRLDTGDEGHRRLRPHSPPAISRSTSISTRRTAGTELGFSDADQQSARQIGEFTRCGSPPARTPVV